MREIGRMEGLFCSPEAAATLAGLRQLITGGQIRPDERVVLFLTGNGLKYHHLVTDSDSEPAAL